MQLHLTPRYLLVFYALSEVLSELHEQAHITVGWLLAGCYGQRNFNTWLACANPAPDPMWLVSLAGPLWSYAMFWIGAVLAWRGRSVSAKAIGWSLLFAALPAARIVTSALGGGDEKTVLALLGMDAQAARWLALAAVVVIAGVPIAIATRAIVNRRAWLWTAGFALLPLPVIAVVKFKFMNGLLASGVLAQVHVLGTPDLVLLYWVAMAAVVATCWRWLLDLPVGQARRAPAQG